MKSTAKIINELDEFGFTVFDLPNLDVVLEIRQLLDIELRKHIRDPEVQLETYHHFVNSDDEHIDIHWKIASAARDQKFTRQLLEGQLEILHDFFGPDLAMSSRDNVRIVRPQVEGDNLDFHRDYDYGNTAFELNILVPFVDVDELTGLAVLPKSHLMEDNELDIVDTHHPTVKKGSLKHQLGFMHSPKIIRNLSLDDAVTPSVKVGQALAFVPHCIHGQVVNSGTSTRWSVDVEVCNALAPIQWNTTNGEPRFEVLTESFFAREGRRKHGGPHK